MKWIAHLSYLDRRHSATIALLRKRCHKPIHDRLGLARRLLGFIRDKSVALWYVDPGGGATGDRGAARRLDVPPGEPRRPRRRQPAAGGRAGRVIGSLAVMEVRRRAARGTPTRSARRPRW